MHKHPNRPIAYVLPIAGLVAFGLNAADATTRSCSATITIGATSLSGMRLHGASYSFTGQGHVGYFAPNTARERARANIEECIGDAWLQRHHTSRPASCSESNRIYGYPFHSLQVGLQQAVCTPNPGYDQILVDVTVLYSGDRGCLHYHNDWSQVVTRAYTVLCPTREYEHGVDRPGLDYSSFPRSSAAQCRDACIADHPRCRAWTYVAATRTEPSAICWLKFGVPPAVPNSCCTSGVPAEP